MNLFQWIALPTLGCLLVVEFVRRFTGRDRGLAWGIRTCMWLAAAAAIYHPNTLTKISKAIGIERGTDLVLYLSVFSFLAVSFYFYARCVRLERQITKLVRHIALNEAQQGDGQNDQ